MRYTLIALLLCSLMLSVACRAGKPIHSYDYALEQSRVSRSSSHIMRDAIVQACVQCGWRAVETHKGLIEASIIVRGRHTVVVSIPYTASHYEIKYKSSVNMGYKVENGQAIIHPNYNKWTQRLDSTIQVNLAAKVI
ncbi:MAG: hypothetical protein IJU76_05030 [Desulfovibrionaceae bacterium]|nr:hypothetical protein [Desulfovibrionaceae bacterium]